MFDAVYWQYKAWIEVPGTDVLASYIAPGDWAIDVGANVGFFTVRFARWTSGDGRVLAFEPEPQNFRQLSRLLEKAGLTGRVDARQAAAADRSGPIRLKINPNHPGDHSLTTEGGIVIDGISIDDAMEAAGNPRVGLMKIDTQGAERIVLDGARKTIERWKPAIFIEVDDQALRNFGTDAESLLGVLKSVGYSFHTIERAGIRSMSTDAVLSSLVAGQAAYLDILCLADAPERA